MKVGCFTTNLKLELEWLLATVARIDSRLQDQRKPSCNERNSPARQRNSSAACAVEHNQTDLAAHPVGASLLFRLSSVKAVAYKLHRHCMFNAECSKVTMMTQRLTFHRTVQSQQLLVSPQAVAFCATCTIVATKVSCATAGRLVSKIKPRTRPGTWSKTYQERMNKMILVCCFESMQIVVVLRVEGMSPVRS